MILLKKNILLSSLRLCFIIVIFTIFSACKSNDSFSLKKIYLNEVTRSIFYCPQYVALKLGFFEREGLEVELKSSEGSDKTMTALLANQCHIALVGSSSVISVHSREKSDPPIIFAQLTKRDGSFIIGRSGDFSWEDMRKKSIIAGRKGGVPEMVLEYILKSKGLIPNQDVTLINNIQFNLMGMAFSRGTGDYVALFEPAASVFMREKGFKSSWPLGAECEPVVYTCYCASCSYIKNNPKTVQSFVNAIYGAQKWIKSHSEDEIAETVASYFADCDTGLLARCIRRYKDADVWCDSPVTGKSDFDLMQKIMQSAGELDDFVDFERTVDNSYAIKATQNNSGG